jgi:cytochrome c oxidase subunit 2
MNDAPLSMFSRASDASSRIANLAWFMIGLSAVIFAGVVVTMVVAARRNRRRDANAVDLSAPGSRFIWWGGAVMPGVVLAAVFIAALGAMRQFSTPAPAVTIRITGHQWWWQADYVSSDGVPLFRTANELHLPVGQPVRLLLASSDVIHSFWVPRLQGKLDVIPGDTNDLRLEVRAPGTYSGACAEYCGRQHAHMMLTVVAESAEDYAEWAEEQARDARPPDDSVTAAGQRLFATTACADCHTIRGTTVRADSAPDLTHVGSRLSIAGGTLATNLGNIEGWIANPQALKPGARMPTLRSYTGPQLRALATYIASLR